MKTKIFALATTDGAQPEAFYQNSYRYKMRWWLLTACCFSYRLRQAVKEHFRK